MKSFKEHIVEAPDHKAMRDFTRHHVLNTTQTHPAIKKKFIKKFGAQHVKHFDNHVSNLVDEYDPELNEATDDLIKKKLKLAKAKSKRLGRDPKVSFMDPQTKKVVSGNYEGNIAMHGHSYAKIQVPGQKSMSTVPFHLIKTVIS